MRPVVWVGPVFEPTGYADEVRGMVTALESGRFPVCLRGSGAESPGFRDTLTSEQRSALLRCVERPVTGAFIHVQHATIDSFAPAHAESVYSIGRSMFETDGLPSHWVAGANALDELWVTSDFNAQTFRDAGVRVPMHIIPGGIDSQFFHPDVEPYAVPGVRGTVFLSVFEWRLRKGWDVLLRAWANAFTPTDDATLVIRAYPIGNVDGRKNADILNERIDRFLLEHCGRARADVAPIVIIGERVPARDLPALYRIADSFVLPTRGEGWGRPFMESMACGVPVIATNWSAHLAFMNHENAYLIEIDGLVPADATEVAVYNGQRWADPSAHHLSTLFRRVHADRAEARARGARARQDMVREWPWSRVASAIRTRLLEIDRSLDRLLLPLRLPAASPSTTGIVVSGGSGETWQRDNGVRDWLGALAHVNGRPVSWHADAPGLRPSYTSPHYFAWQRAGLAIESVGVTVHVLDEHVVPELTPSDGVRVVDTGTTVKAQVPPTLVTLLRDEADVVVVPHLMAYSAALAAGVEASRVEIVEPVTDIERFTPLGAVYRNACAGGTRFLLIGGDRPHRALRRIVEVYDRAFSSLDDVVLHIVLPYTRDEDLTRWRERMRIEAAGNKRHPHLPRLHIDTATILSDELPSLYRSVDVLLHAGAATGGGRTMREALACGIPVIASQDAVATSLIGADAGWLLPSTIDPAVHARALASAMREATNVSTRRACGQAARQRAESWPSPTEAFRARASHLERWSLQPPRASSGDAWTENVVPYVFAGSKRVIVLAHLDWHSGAAPAVARAFASACSAQDDVTLALCHDPAQALSAEQAAAQVHAAMLASGRSEDELPDTLLITEALDTHVLHRLYAAADVVVALRYSASDARARRMGRSVIGSMDQTAWRHAIQQVAGLPHE